MPMSNDDDCVRKTIEYGPTIAVFIPHPYTIW